ncbi:carbohydrate-binding module family 20 domain-containing protein [Pseudomonas cyclaminis]|uniref:carbohydrate-binding module family 20 domain-containing protein n=1 Tax=Pseudomonas cyclaminis TaxID=2781239 RepID=UPI0037FB6F7D
MFRTYCLLPLGAFVLTLLPFANAGQNVQITYFLSASFTCLNGNTKPGYSVYVVGSHRDIGEWKTEKAVLLTTTPTDYPKWTGQVRFSGVQLDEKVEWKCIIRNENSPYDVKEWQPDPNSEVILKFSPQAQASASF